MTMSDDERRKLALEQACFLCKSFTENDANKVVGYATAFLKFLKGDTK